jgi:hypothetical protein
MKSVDYFYDKMLRRVMFFESIFGVVKNDD